MFALQNLCQEYCASGTGSTWGVALLAHQRKHHSTSMASACMQANRRYQSIFLLTAVLSSLQSTWKMAVGLRKSQHRHLQTIMQNSSVCHVFDNAVICSAPQIFLALGVSQSCMVLLKCTTSVHVLQWRICQHISEAHLHANAASASMYHFARNTG